MLSGGKPGTAGEDKFHETQGNLLTMLFDATREEVTYSPSQLRAQTRESHLYRKEMRDIAEGERIQFTRPAVSHQLCKTVQAKSWRQH